MPAMRYPNEYSWLVFVATLDILFTWTILEAGGVELNPLAAMVINRWSLGGMIAYRFSLLLFVILACEEIGRTRDRMARSLVQVGVLISSIPVALAMAQLSAMATYGMG